MEIISEINITDEKIAIEVNEFLNENCKAMNKALWKHADTTKILFENNRRYDKKIAEIKQISSYIESNKDKHENLTKTKFNE
jgi:fructose-1,6-bisphosphatase/sedoheptulose 1,7-bisphosphatase-like protein